MDMKEVVEEVLRNICQKKPSQGEVEVELIIDVTKTNYLVYYNGWDGERRMYGQIAHIQIKNNKIWIHHDGTAPGLARMLEARGIKKNQIVLGFMDEFHRELSGYAVT